MGVDLGPDPVVVVVGPDPVVVGMDFAHGVGVGIGQHHNLIPKTLVLLWRLLIWALIFAFDLILRVIHFTGKV